LRFDGGATAEMPVRPARNANVLRRIKTGLP
jgi:hypothetical protein